MVECLQNYVQLELNMKATNEIQNTNTEYSKNFCEQMAQCSA